MQLYNNQPVKSLNYAKKALVLAENTKQTKYLILTYGTLAATYWALSNYSAALDYLFKKLKILEKEKEHRELAKTYKHIALVLFSSEQDSLAMMYINKSIAICEKYNFKTGIADAYNLKANIKFQAGDTVNIEQLWIKSKEIYEQNNKLLKAAAIEHNLGMLFFEKKLYHKALKSFEYLLNISRQNNDKLSVTSSIENIGSVYEEMGDFESARTYYIQMRDSSEKYNFPVLEMRAYYSLFRLDSTAGNYRSALNNYITHTQLRDSIYSNDKEEKISELQIKYETEKTEKENIALRKEKRINMLILIALGVGFFLVIIILFFLWKIVKIKQKHNQLLIKSNKEILSQQEKIEAQNNKLKKQSEELLKHEEYLKNLVEKRTKELLKVNEKAKESDKLKSAFLTNLSHEIRTPLNAIMGFVDILTTHQLNSGERDKYLEIIQGSSNRLLEVINNIVDLSKIETGKMDIHKQEFQVRETILELLEEFKDEKTEFVKLIFDNKDDFHDIKLYTDKGHFIQILKNLLDNALKFTEKGKVNLGYKPTKDDFVEFYVKDTGIGIPKEYRKSIFEQFRKIELEKEKLYPGTGLGLSISKSLVKVLGGKMWLVDDYEAGAMFVFTLPCKKS